MTLEAALEANTKAVNELAKLMAAAQKLGTKAVAAKAASSDEAEPKKAPAKGRAKKLTKDDVLAMFKGYLGELEDDDEDLPGRKEDVKAISDHFGVGRIGLLKAADFEEAVGHLKACMAGENPDFMNEAAAAEESLV